jgi:hypothetical protein
MFEYIINIISTMFHTASNHIRCRIKSKCCFKSTNVDVPVDIHTPKIIEIINIFNYSNKHLFDKQTSI